MSLEWFSLAGKVALVTGAAQGIGRAIAEALAAAGARLIIAGRQAEKLVRTATALTSQGYEVVSVPADVAHAGQVREVVEGGLAVYGALDILVNNAGGSGNIGVDAIEDVSEELWDEIVNANLRRVPTCAVVRWCHI
jgi:NAD(P)-dependent dehydrogenase (short-subunit alcohol dehydrogenase family)